MPSAALAAIFVTSFGVGFTGALMPGPLTTVAVRESIQRGFWAGPLLAAGHSLIELALVVGLALGLSRFLTEDSVKAGVGIAGGLFLLWMGVHIATSRAEPPLVVERPPPSDGPGAPYDGSWRRRWLRSLAGGETASRSLPRTAAVVMSAAILVSVFNPGWLAWWASVGSAFISQSLEQGAAGVASFYIGHILSDILWLSLLAFVLASGRRVMSGGVYRGVLVVCGLFLLGLGTYFLASGLVLIS
jgi:threonine/homoserine/homoserine lactone efflux protein